VQHKLVLLPGYTEIAAEIKRLKLHEERIPGLFEPEKFVTDKMRLYSFRSSPLPPTRPLKVENEDNGYESVFTSPETTSVQGAEEPTGLQLDGVKQLASPTSPTQVRSLGPFRLVLSLIICDIKKTNWVKARGSAC
jgi:hypothetical protein